MGYYTQLRFKATLKKETPESVINTFKQIILENSLLDHEFDTLCCGTNGEPIQGGLFYKQTGHWVIDLHTEFKNYNLQIDKFIHFILPYVIIGRKKYKYLGWFRGESDRTRSYIRIPNDQLSIHTYSIYNYYKI